MLGAVEGGSCRKNVHPKSGDTGREEPLIQKQNVELVAKAGKLEDLRDLEGQDFQGSLLPSSVFCFDKTYQHM